MSDYFDFPSAPVLDREEGTMDDGLNDETFGLAAEATDWEAEHERLAGLEGGLEEDGEFVEFSGLDDDEEEAVSDVGSRDSIGAAAMHLPSAYQQQLEELQRQHELQFQQQQKHFQQQHHHQQQHVQLPAKVAAPNLGGEIDEFPLEDLNAFCDRLVVDSDDELDDPSIITASKNRPMRPRNSSSATYSPAAAGPPNVQQQQQPMPLPPPPPGHLNGPSFPSPPAAWAAAIAANLSRLPPHQQQQAAAAAAAAAAASGMMPGGLPATDPGALLRNFAMAAAMAAAKQQQQHPQHLPQPLIPPAHLLQQLLQSVSIGGPQQQQQQQQQQPTPQQLAALRALAAQNAQRIVTMQQQPPQLPHHHQQQQQQQQSDPRVGNPMVQPKPNSPFASFRRWPFEYDNFMTRRDKDSIIGIQCRVLEREMEDPVTSDYYYITWRLKQARRNNPGIFPSIPVPRSADDPLADQQLAGGEDAASSGAARRAAELQMSGTLGCLTTSSVHTPRQIIDIKRRTGDSAEDTPNAPSSSAPADLELRRHRGLMLRIESLYCVYLRFDDCDKRYLTSTEAEKRHICVTERRKALEALCAGFFGDSDLPLLLSVRKGRRLLKSVLNSCDKDLLFSALRSLLICLPGLRQQQLEAEGLTELSLAFSAAIRRLESNIVEELLNFALQLEPSALFGHELPCHWFFDLLGRHSHFCLARADPPSLRRMADRVAGILTELPSDSLACIAQALPTAGQLHSQLVDHLAPPVRLLAERKFSRILLPTSAAVES